MLLILLQLTTHFNLRLAFSTCLQHLLLFSSLLPSLVRIPSLSSFVFHFYILVSRDSQLFQAEGTGH